MTEGVFDHTLGVMRYDMTKSTGAAQSLRDQTKAKAAPHNETILSFMKLSGTMPAKLEADQVKFLQAALRSHMGDGVPEGTSTKSKNSLKDAQKSKDMPTLRKNLADVKQRIKETTGLSEQLQETVILSIEKMANQHIVQKLAEMISDSPYLLMLMHEGNETIEAASFLAARIDDLEEAIALTERDSARLVAESEARHRHSLSEDTVFGHTRPIKRRSTGNLADDFEPSEDNAFLMNETRQGHVDPKMAVRANYLNNTMRNVDVTPDHQCLTETWNLQNK